MEPTPTAAVVRTREWKLAAGGLLVAVAFAFHTAVLDMVDVWASKADYSHGFLVPVVAAYLLWVRRDKISPNITWPDALGVLPIVLGVLLSVAGGVTNKAKEFAQGFGLILALTGVLILLMGRHSLRWSWPGLAYLVFMLKLPDRLEIQFMFKLRQVATTGSNYVLQTLGYPSYVAGQEGTVITVGELKLGVEWACSGLSMVLTFVAVAVAVALLVKRPLADRRSSPPPSRSPSCRTSSASSSPRWCTSPAGGSSAT
jgi:exosortase